MANQMDAQILSNNSPAFAPLTNNGDSSNENMLVHLSHTKLDSADKQSPVSNAFLPNLSVVSPEISLFRYMAVDIGKSVNINVSHVNSTRSFFLHLNFQEVEDFYSNFNDYYYTIVTAESDMHLKTSSIFIKQLCCVLNHEDSSYYRAQILKETGGEYLVRFVDFGDTKIVQPASIFKLFPDLAQIPFFALHCYLAGDWTADFAKLETALLDFSEIPNSYCTDIKAKFQPSESQSKMAVSLEVQISDGSWKDLKDCNFDRVNVAECVSEHIFNFKDFAQNFLTVENFRKSNEVYRKLSSSLHEARFSNARTYSGICINVLDISNFIFSQSLATEFTTNLSFFYRGLSEHICTSVKVHSLVVFGIENKFFFRGIVLGVDNNSQQYELFSLDFGFVFSVKADEIFALFEHFSLAKFPCFSALCALHNIVPILDNKWSPIAVKTFQGLVKGTITIYPKGFSNGNHSVEVEVANKNRVSEMLKKFKLGKDELL